MPWTPLDYIVLNGQGQGFTTPLGPGTADWVSSINFQAVGANQLWRVERLTCQFFEASNERLALGSVVNNTTGPAILVYVFDQAQDNPLQPTVAAADYTQLNADPVSGMMAIDVADNAAPITVLEGNALQVSFLIPGTTNPPTGVAIVRAQIQVLGGTSGKPQPVAGAVAAPRLSPGY